MLNLSYHLSTHGLTSRLHQGRDSQEKKVVHIPEVYLNLIHGGGLGGRSACSLKKHPSKSMTSRSGRCVASKV